MLDALHIVYESALWFYVVYSIAILIIYTWIGWYAYGALVSYRHKNLLTDYKLIATNPNAPTFSIIAPAYNEGMTIVENVRSLLSLYYNNLEIIIINDGSKDDSIDRLIDAYDLEAVSYLVHGTLATKEIKSIYRSKNPAYKKLLVVDKFNGGKADALNVGINVSAGEYIVCIDVDCILEQDALLKLAKPFLEQTDKRLIACGGSIRLANNCKIENGKIVDVSLPKTLLGKMQALEYIRAFVLGRMAWSRASGLILISGAFGAFDKQIVLDCGGYDPSTVGEDMELVVRMRRHMEEQKIPYSVLNIPDPLCWTEVPESKEILTRQRNRWMRGTIETLWKHRKLFFNPKYGKLGMISYPYWFFFEFLGPLVEYSGFIIFFLFLILGIIDWTFFVALMCLVLCAGIFYSIYAILVDLVSYKVYTKVKDLSKLIYTAVLEPFYFHPTVVRAGVAGVRDYFRKQHSWGDMQRQGFHTQGSKTNILAYLKQYFNSSLQYVAPMIFIYLLVHILFTVLEGWYYTSYFEAIKWHDIFSNLLLENIDFILQTSAIIIVLNLLLNFFSINFSRTVTMYALSGILLAQLLLMVYFAESLNLLGADIRYYTRSELYHILQTSGMVTWQNLLMIGIAIGLCILPMWLVAKRKLQTAYPALIILLLGIGAFMFNSDYKGLDAQVKDEFTRNVARSKWNYLGNSLFEDVVASYVLFEKHDQNTNGNASYPFLKEENTPDVLGQYFEKSNQVPNLVILVIEGLGSAYSSSDGYMGNFTPFIDSLAQHSLYWKNNLSASGRTFGVLPTILGSLPFGEQGFLSQVTTPPHFNLYNVLKKNSFSTGFYYGGNATFDGMRDYLIHAGVDRLIDEDDFDGNYQRLPNIRGESWGMDDQSLFRRYLADTKVQDIPHVDLLLTLSMHSPFEINNVDQYELLFDKYLPTLNLDDKAKALALQHKKQLVMVLNTDDALRAFFDGYKKRQDFANTIFVITGDHAMPEIPLSTKIDRYHVPLMIYSPLLKAKQEFRQLVSHMDLAPSILAYYRMNYHIKTPNQVTWLGKGLAVSGSDAKSTYAMMPTKNQLTDFIQGNYHLSDGQLFKISHNLIEEPIVDENTKNKLKSLFQEFKVKNRKFSETNTILPDSIYQEFMSRDMSKH